MNTATATLNQKAFMVQNYNLQHALLTLQRGGLILYPTDTVWGIGCDATNEAAVQRIFTLKQIPAQSLIVLVDSLSSLRQYVQVHPRIETLLHYHTRPLTVIYDDHQDLAPNLQHVPSKSVAIRIVKDDFCKSLIRALGKPIVATSANIETAPVPRTFGEISSQIIQGVDHVVKYRQWEKTPMQPSVMVRLGDKELEFLRE